MSDTPKKKTCFVVSPIGASASPERIHADWLFEGIIKPVFEANYPDFEVVRADKMPAPGMIDSQIIEHLLDSELVIADITTLNPNVFYEIGIRHMAQKPVVHMVLEEAPIPFDIKIFKHIPFSVKTPQGLVTASAALKDALDAVFNADFKVDNPVTRTRARVELESAGTPTERIFQRMLDELQDRVTRMERESEIPPRQLQIPGFSSVQRRAIGAHKRALSDQYIVVTVTDTSGIGVDALSDKVSQISNDYFVVLDLYLLRAKNPPSVAIKVENSVKNWQQAQKFAQDLHGEEWTVEISSLA